MLCRVMAKTKRVVRCQLVSTPSVSLCLKLICRWGRYLSKANKKSAPRPNPTAAGITLVNPSPSLIAMAGANRLQKLAATITPPVNPSIPSSTLRFMVLKKNTKEAPNAVTSQVKVVAIKAPITGSTFSKNDMIESNMD